LNGKFAWVLNVLIETIEVDKAPFKERVYKYYAMATFNGVLR